MFFSGINVQAADLGSAASAPESEPIKETSVDVKFFGRVSQAFRFSNGAAGASRSDIVDNDNSGSEFGFKGQFQHGDLFSNVKLALDAEFETTDELNFGSGVETEGLDDFPAIDTASIAFGHNQYGALSIGFDDTATDGFSELDLSGTTVFAESDVQDIGGELQFGNSISPQLGTSFEVDDFFNNLDGPTASRILYETPEYGVGIGKLQFQAAARVIDEVVGDPNDAVQFAPDVSVRYKGKVNGFKFDSGIAYRRTNDITIGDFEVDTNTFHGSVSAIAPTGTNLTLAGGIQTFSNSNQAAITQAELDDNELFVYAKLGQRVDFFEFGKTSFSVDVFYGEQIEDQDDAQFIAEAFSVGGGVTQNIKPLSLDLYAAARYYSVDFKGQGAGGSFLDNTGAITATPAQLAQNPDGIFVLFTGARVKF